MNYRFKTFLTNTVARNPPAIDTGTQKAGFFTISNTLVPMVCSVGAFSLTAVLSAELFVIETGNVL